ncbi:hypothetical protein [Streptomyces sp. NPDC056632]|uniref:hypothetical protein n=1 Tax=Streptomyces sp. NPDC056632 TaxID=3345884 RepID=UPI0036B6AEB9
MSEAEELVRELGKLPSAPPGDTHELAELLVTLKGAAGRWAEFLYDVRASAHALAGPRALAALELAFRKAEESYVELEIAHGDVKARGGSPSGGPGRGSNNAR